MVFRVKEARQRCFRMASMVPWLVQVLGNHRIVKANTRRNKDFFRRADVEALLKVGPDGLFLVKNSTEFPGDLTLCLFKVRIFAHCTNWHVSQYLFSSKFSLDDVSNFAFIDTYTFPKIPKYK